MIRGSTIVALLLLAGLCACRHDRAAPTGTLQAAVHVEPSSREVSAGETVIVSARTENTFGRETKITWRTSGGTLKKEDIGDLARVTFPSPGTYRVTARLAVKGEPTHQDSVEIHVR
jgi:hypothetical protein